MASSAVNRRDEPSGLIFVTLLAASVIAHATLVSAMKSETPLAATRRSVEMAFFEEKRVETPKVEVTPPVIKTRAVTRVAKPQNDLPPPPTQESVKPIEEPVVPIVGIEPDATSQNGKFVVPIGNSSIGPANKIVNEVKSYSGSKFAPPGSADSEPTVIGEVKVEYPPDAKLNDIDGAVRLRVTTDERGVVTSVVVISGPGYGLNEAARDALKRFTFKPATKAGEPIGYTFTYTYRFELN